MSFTLNHYTQKPASGKPPKQIILLLHGYGSNGRDLISLAPFWAKAVPDAIFISPDAPFPCEAGMGFQWFSLMEYTQAALLRGTKEAHPILDSYIDALLHEYNLTDKDLALVGFSQGTMMSLYTGIRRANKIAGVLGYSGALIHENDLAPLPKPPIHLIHGQADPVVTVERYESAKSDLTDAGFTVSGHSTPHLEHSIDEDGIQSGASFIETIFQ